VGYFSKEPACRAEFVVGKGGCNIEDERMDFKVDIPEPLLFNPLKHYLPFIRGFVSSRTLTIYDPGLKELTRELKHIGTCVMDIYTGQLTQEVIFKEILDFLETSNLKEKEVYKSWTGTDFDDYRIVALSDTSQWTLKYHNHETRYIHIFPARSSPYSFRIKANTLKSAILYIIIFGKDYISDDDLNAARALAGLSPVREAADTEAVTEMIEILRK
jgi:DNA-binding ferritin-like protein (Dps family)